MMEHRNIDPGRIVKNDEAIQLAAIDWIWLQLGKKNTAHASAIGLVPTVSALGTYLGVYGKDSQLKRYAT